MTWSDSQPLSDATVLKPWWQPLITLINFVLLGYFLRLYFGWNTSNTAKFRRFTFNVLLPVYVLRNMWISHVDSSMYGIALVSMAIHIFQACFWYMLFRNVQDRALRGWLSMITQGCLTSFLYANIGSHSSFGQQAVAVCLMFDIGGNTPCAQGLLWGLAAYFSPDQHRMAGKTTGSFHSGPLLPRNSFGDSELVNISRGQPNVGSWFATGSNSDHGDMPPEFSYRLSREEYYDNERKSKWEIAQAVIYQPILPAFAVGLLLSFMKVGCPVVVDNSLELFGSLFRPCLYFLIGLCCEVITCPSQVRIVATVLGLRYIFAGFLAAMMWLWLPYTDTERTTMALTLLSPVSTMTMYLVAEYNYPAHYVGMSATITTISVFISFAIQESIIRTFSG